MLEKLAAIANYADRYGQYEVADDATQLLKNAQLFDALRTLFDPGSSELDPGSGYWKRLQRGWSRGKMDRGVGLLLAINAERTKLNKRINELAAPLKLFQEQVGSVYEKLLAGSSDLNAGNLKNELKGLQSELKGVLSLVAGKELRKALMLRSKLQEQEIKALDKVKGLPPESKEFLAAVLRGEKPSQLGMNAKPSIDEPTKLKMVKWLKGLGVKSKPGAYGRKSSNVNVFRYFMRDYAMNPVSITEFFDANPEAMQAGYDNFGRDFSEMLYWAENVMNLDSKQAKKEETGDPLPGAVTQVLQDEPKAKPGKKEKEQPVAPMFSDEDLAPRQKTPAPKDDEVLSTKIMQDLEKKKEEEDRAAELAQMRGLIEKENPQVVSPATAKRIERQITRLGRLRKVKSFFLIKNAEDMDMDIFDANPEGQERFNEEKDYDQNQVMLDMYTDVQDPYDEESKINIDNEYNKVRILADELAKTNRLEDPDKYYALREKIKEQLDSFRRWKAYDPENDADDIGKRSVVIRKQDGEFRVPGPNGTEEEAYYTDDKEDAIGTAKAMYDEEISIKFRHGFPGKVNKEIETEWIDNILRS